MSVPKSLALVAALVLELTTWANAAPRYRGQSPYTLSVPAQGGGGYSSDPRTRELQVLADKYRPCY